VRVVAGGGYALQVGSGRLGQVVVGGQAHAGAHRAFLEQGQARAEDVAEHGADESHPGRRVQAQRLQLGQCLVVDVQGMRP
jgi:hypothetical protein